MLQDPSNSPRSTPIPPGAPQVPQDHPVDNQNPSKNPQGTTQGPPGAPHGPPGPPRTPRSTLSPPAPPRTPHPPGDIVDQPGLEQQVPPGQEVLGDEVLVGADSHGVADAEGAEHVQHLGERGHDTRTHLHTSAHTCACLPRPPQRRGPLLTLWLRPCLSRREMMDLMWFSWMMLRTSGLSIRTQYSTSRIPAGGTPAPVRDPRPI